MARYQSSKWLKSILLIISVVLAGWLFWTDVYQNKGTTAPAAANPLASAWQLAQAVGQYDFSVAGRQLLRPRPIPAMIGQSGQAVDINIEGKALSPVAAQLTVKLDGFGLDPAPVTLLQEGGQTYIIKAGEKKLAQNPVGAMAPTGSYISYLAAADNVQPCEEESALAGAAACYTYDINGPHFAEYIRAQLQTAIDNDPAARPLGAAVQISPSPQLMKMSGTGVVILDAHNLPLRMVLDTVTPEIDQLFDGQNHLIVDFEFDPDAVQVAMAAQANAEPWWHRFDPANLDFSGPISFVVALVPMGLLLVWHRRRWFYGFIVVLVIGSMVSTPLAQAANITRYVQRQAEAAQTMADTFSTDNASVSVPVAPHTSDAAPLAAPVFEPDAYCGKDNGINRDSDSDGLADDAEYCLGTNPFAKDSDYDGLPDGVETTGFDLNGKTWYGDPLRPDSNNDGVNDAVEWKKDTGLAAEWDLDDDGVPNLWDYDDDGDGVDDRMDISPHSRTGFIAEDEFSFDIVGSYDGYTYVDMQVRPADPAHLFFGTTPLDWRSPDSKGQITDLNQSEDDINLIPMLEVETNLPPNFDLARQYNVTVFSDTLKIGRQRMTIPLYPIADGGEIQAFGFRLVYSPDELKTLGDTGIHWQNARMVWTARAKLDEQVGDRIVEKESPVHTYIEPAIQLTGWQVIKSGPARSAIIGTPNTPDDDRNLFQILFGLSSAFLNNPNLTLDEVNNRLSGINTPIEQRWGVSANVVVDLPIDAAPYYDAGLEVLNDRLNSFFGTHYPANTLNTAIIAGESEMGLYGQDDLGQFEPQGDKLSVNLRNISMARQRSLLLQARDGTKVVQGVDLAAAMLNRYKDDVDTALDDLIDQYPLLTVGELVSLLQTMYLTWDIGMARAISYDGLNASNTGPTDTEIYEMIYTTPRDRYGEPENISTLPGYLVEAGRFAREGSGMIFSGGPGQIWQHLQANAAEADALGFSAAATEFMNQATTTINQAMGNEDHFSDVDFSEITLAAETKNETLVASINYIGSSWGAINSLRSVVTDVAANVFKSTNKLTKLNDIKTGAGKSMAAIAVGVDIALIWLKFALTGDFSPQAIVMAIAQTIVVLVFFAISQIPPWIFSAIMAIVGIVDAILSILGEDFSISGEVSKIIAKVMYDIKPLSEIGDVKFLGRNMGLVDEEAGYVVGNRYYITDTMVGSMQVISNGFKVTTETLKNYNQVFNKSLTLDQFKALATKNDQTILKYSHICAEYVVTKTKVITVSAYPPSTLGSLLNVVSPKKIPMTISVIDDSVPKTDCERWNFDRSYDYDNRKVTYTNTLRVDLLLKEVGESRFNYLQQIVAQTTNKEKVWGGLAYSGYKSTKMTLPKDMAKEDQWRANFFTLDILPTTLDGFWWGESDYVTNHDPDGDGLRTDEEIIMSIGQVEWAKLMTAYPDELQSGELSRILAHWNDDDYGNDRADICNISTYWATFCQPNVAIPWLVWDTDGDGLSDKFEFDENGRLGVNWLMKDTDGDGLNDGLEYRMSTRIDLADSDLDGLPDSEEVLHLKSDGTLGGGWNIEVLKPLVGPTGRYTATVTVYSDPLSADADGDGLSDLEEKKYSTSPTAYNRMPKVELTGSPFAVSPAGAAAVYVKPGTEITFNATVQSFIPYTVAGTINADMPWHLLSAAQFTGFSGDSSPANTGQGGNPEWSFAADPLLPGEEAHTTITAQTAGSQSMTGTATIRLPIEPSGWQPLSSGLNHSQYVSSVSALALDPNNHNVLYAGGLFNAAGGRPASNIARWNGSSWAALGTGVDSRVYAAVVDGSGQLYVGGSFTHAGGQRANRIAKWTGTGWQTLGDGFNDWVYGLALDSDDNLYAVGNFTKSGATTVNGVAKWNGNSWSALGSGVDNMTESWVSTIAIDANDNIYIGGHFYSVSGVNAAHAAKWNGSSWAKMGDIYGGGGLSGSIKTMVVNPVTNELYAGGDIWQVDSTDAKSGVLKWTGSGWQVLPYVPDNPATAGGHKTYALTFAADGTLYAGGVWPTDDSKTEYLARWDGSDWATLGQPTNNSASAYLSVNTIVSDGDGVFTGGTFDSVADIPAKNVAYYLSTDSNVQEDTVTVVVDAENPTVGIVSPYSGELIGGGVTDYVIGGHSGDVTSWVTQVEVKQDNTALQTITRTPDNPLSPWAYTWSLPPDGIYNLSVAATDYVGWSAGSSNVAVMVDNTPPTVTINLAEDAIFGPPQSGDVITIDLNGAAFDTWSGLTRIQISADGSPWTEMWTVESATDSDTTFTDHTAVFRRHATAATWSAEWTLPNVESVQGYHNLKIRAFDRAGNEPQVLERNFIIDVIPPTDELTNRAYLYDYPHLPVGIAHPLRGVANDVGNVPQPARPDDLLGTLDSIDNATIWLGLDSIADDDAGVTIDWIGDFNGDRRGDLLIGTPASAGGAGRVTVVYGRAGNWAVPDAQEMIADSYSSFVGVAGAGLGEYAVPAGDVNGDGIRDLLVGDPVNNSVYIIFGKPFYYGRDIVLDGPQTARRIQLTAPQGQQIGSHIGAAGDVNGDGVDDILIGVTNGPAYLLMGAKGAWHEIMPLEIFNAATISGAGNATLAGVGDLDGDFYDEFAVGLNGVAVFKGKATYANQGRQSLSTGSADYTFGSGDGQPGIARLGDVNGDQRDDFIFTTGGNQNLVSGGSVIHTYSYGAGFVAAPGDVDNDGLNDILIGGNGNAHLVLGSNLSGTQATISGVAAAASTLYPAGADLNSDGSSDLLLLPAAVGGVAANDASAAALPDLPPAWMPRLPEQNLSTYVDNTNWAVSGADAYVNGDGSCHGQSPCFSTIQAAVNAVNSTGQLISVQPGVYAPFTIDGSSSTKTNLTVRGTNPDAVFVDAGGSGAAAHIKNANGVRLEQMTLRNASYGVQLTDAGVGGHKDTELHKRAILDHLLIYDVGAYDVYMDRSSTITVTRSTLVNTGNHVGVDMSDAFDSTIPVGWQADLNTPWAIYEGGGLAAISDTVYAWIGGGNGNRGFTHRDISEGESWSAGADSTPGILEPGSTMGAGSDGRLYAVGAPGWNALGTPNSYQIAADVVVAPNGHVFVASVNAGNFAYDNGAAWEWDGSQWITYHDNVDPYTPLGGNKYHVALSPTDGGLYLSGGWCVSDQDYCGIARWDGVGWEDLLPPKGSREMAFTSDGTLYATNYISGVLRYTGSSWQILGNPANFGYGGGKGLHIDADDNIYVAGLASLDYQYPYIGKWNGSSWTSVGFPVAWNEPYDIKALTTDADGTLYACGHFGDSGVAKNTGGSSWELLPAIPNDTGLYQDCDDIAFNSSIYVAGTWQSNDGSTSTYHNVMRWDDANEKWEYISNRFNPPFDDIYGIAAGDRGIYVAGNFNTIGIEGNSVTTNHIAQYHFFHGVYSPTVSSWATLPYPPGPVGVGSSYAGAGDGHMVLIRGGGTNDTYSYNIGTGKWDYSDNLEDENNSYTPINVTASAMTQGDGGWVYAIVDGGQVCSSGGTTWECYRAKDIDEATMGTISGGASLTYDPKRKVLYAFPGGNSRNMLRYQFGDFSNNNWELLPSDRNTPTGIKPGAGMVYIPGTNGGESALYAAEGNYEGGSSKAFWRYPLPEPNKIGFEDSAIVVPAANSAADWLNQSDPLPDDFNFRIGTGSRWFNSTGKPNNGWSLPRTTDNPFLDQPHHVYRMGQTGYDLGYHAYTEPVTATTATGIQAQLNSGANRVIVQPGIYEESVYLPNGVEVIGANPDWTIIRPPTGSGYPVARAEGPAGASLSRVTLDGQNQGVNGFEATGNAENITLARSLIYDTDTAVLVDGAGSDLEVFNVTAGLNANGFAATNDAPVDVRNSLFAYNSGVGLSHTAGAATQNHQYNLFWENLGGHFGGAADAGPAELLIDPNLVDPPDHDFRTLNFSPVIDAGNPSDPAPPSDGNRADIGYIEQGRANFYVDDNYCLTCVNDGLTWQVDAFATIQDALDAAKATLQHLNATEADVPQLVVGVAAGTYTENVIVPGHTLLLGSGAEVTTLNGSVTFDGVTDAGLRDFTITGVGGAAVHVTGAGNNIFIHHNIISGNGTGILLDGRGTGGIVFNTLVNNAISVQAEGAGSWANVMNNIISGGSTGLYAVNNGQIFSDYNLLNASANYNGVTPGDFDLGGNPQFDSGNSSAPYRLTPASPALDAAAVGVTVPDGGGERADLGYSELLAAPVSLLLGKEDLSTVMGNSGVQKVEYAVVPVADPTQPVTATLPGAWNPVTLDTPGATYSYWEQNYTPTAEGLHRFYSRATDMVDNTETDELDWYDGSFVADSAAPVVEWLSPTDGTALNAPLELRARVTDYAAGEFSVEEKDVHFVVGGTDYPAVWAAEPWDENAGEARVFRAWVDPGSTGSITAKAVAEDKAGNTGQSATVTLTVSGTDPTDTSDPALVVFTPINNGWVTSTVRFAGTVSDSGSGVTAVEASVDGGLTWHPAEVSGNSWSLDWQGPAEQSFVSYPAKVRATDRAGNSMMTGLVFTMDEMPPEGLTPVTFNYPEGTHFDTPVDLTINWEAPIDGSGTATTLLTVDRLTDTVPSASITGSSANRTLDASGEWYVHLGAEDAAGNKVVLHYGPWYVGIDEGVAFGSRRQSIMVDGFIDEANNEWQLDSEFLDNDERNIGTNVTYSPDGPQSFFTTWDQDQFYVAWRGGWWQMDGTLWVYLNTGSGGSTSLIQPLTSSPGAGLPFAANYAVQINAPDDGTLWQYSGGWQVSGQDWAFAQGAGGDTEIRLPLFGTTNIEALAFAQGDNGNAWAVFPAMNTLTPATVAQGEEVGAMAEMVAPLAGDVAALLDLRVQDTGWRSFQWPDLTVVTDPAANQPKAVNFEMELDSVQSHLVPWAPGSTMEYVVNLHNQEERTLTNQQVAFVAFPGTALLHDSIEGATCSATNPAWVCTVSSLPPGTTSITLTTHLATDLTGIDEVTMIAVLQNPNIPPEMQTQDMIAHQTDSLSPVVTVSSWPFAKPGELVINGVADDGTGIGVDFVEILPDGGSWQRAAGTDIWSADLTVSPFVHHGDAWRFYVRGTDQYGQVSQADEHIFTVDLQGPVVTLSSASALKGMYNELSGTVVDGPTGSQAVQAEVSVDDGMWAEAFLSDPDDTGRQVYFWGWDVDAEDAITHTVQVRAIDTVGNTGTLSETKKIVIDNVGPQLTVTHALTQAVVQDYRPGRRVTGGPVISGTVTDGRQVATVTVRVEPPGGGYFYDSATVISGTWQFVPEMTLVGTYTLQAEGVDWLGNRGYSDAYPLIVIAAPETASDPYETFEDTPIVIEPLEDDVDLDLGDILSIDSVGVPLSGTATISGSFSIVYTPTLNFNGTDVFTYTAIDINSLTDTCTISVTVLPVNDAPVITPGGTITMTISEDNDPIPFDLTLFGEDVDFDPLTWTVSISQAYGAVTLSPVADIISQTVTSTVVITDSNPPTDTVTITHTEEITSIVYHYLAYTTTVAYTPTAQYAGPANFAVEASDGTLTDTVTISLTIEPVEDAPVANDDPVIILRSGETFTFLPSDSLGRLDVLGNDYDPEGAVLTITQVSLPDQGGTAELDAAGKVITYTPTTVLTGTEIFTYSVTDGGFSSTATVTATVVSGEIGGASGQTFTTTAGVSNTITVTVAIPAGVITDSEELVLVYTEIVSTPTKVPSGQKYAGLMFKLAAYVNGVQTRPYTFTPPITLTLTYSDTDVTDLSVWYWWANDELQTEDLTATAVISTGWYADGITVVGRYTDTNKLVVTIERLGDYYGLFGLAANGVYLPIIIGGGGPAATGLSLDENTLYLPLIFRAEPEANDAVKPEVEPEETATPEPETTVEPEIEVTPETAESALEKVKKVFDRLILP